jgi:predicted acyl esterase
MTTRDVMIAMADGVTVAATLYLPDVDRAVPCLLEALPYRKDDVPSSYTPEYVRLRDEFGHAVCRLDLRCTIDRRTWRQRATSFDRSGSPGRTA